MERSTSNALLILLWGGRVEPTIVLAHQLNPAAVVCLVSRDRTNPPVGVLRRVLPQAVIPDPVEVDPYRTAATLDALEEARRRFPDLRPIVSVTSATVPMTVAGYEMARHWGCPAYYINTRGGEVLDLTRPDEPDPLRMTVKVDTYVRIHGLEPIPPEQATPYATTPETRQAAALKLARGGRPAVEVLAWLRGTGAAPQETAAQGAKHKVWPGHFTAAHRGVLQMLEAHGVIRHVRFSARQVSFEIPQPGEGEFLRGDWLEQYVLAVGQELRARRVFYDCAAGVRLRSGAAEREVDFIATFRGMVLIAGCKAVKRPWKKAYLDELGAVAKILGGDYVTRLYITDGVRTPPSPGRSDPFPAFAQQAAQQRAVIVTGDDLPRLDEVLQREVERPTYPPR
ncbi:MAG: hypothetical protein N2383_15520 [Caldilineales bacterium]|nr:hypothetical protein [Caldilineales bacterium]